MRSLYKPKSIANRGDVHLHSRGGALHVVAIPGTGKKIELYSRRVAGVRSIQRGTLAKTGLTPAVKDSVDQVVRHGVVLGDMLMALFAFPRALKNPCYLFEYSGHLF